MLGVVQLGGTAGLFPENVVDVFEGLFKHELLDWVNQILVKYSSPTTRQASRYKPFRECVYLHCELTGLKSNDFDPRAIAMGFEDGLVECQARLIDLLGCRPSFRVSPSEW